MLRAVVKGVIVKPGTLNVSRNNCYRVIMKNRRLDHPNYGKWEPVSRIGFTVVCASKLEAEELILLIGGAMYPPPDEWTNDDDRYLAWLKHHHFKVQPYQATGKREVMYGEFIRGWVPDAHELESGVTDTVFAQMVQPVMRQVLLAKDGG